MLNGSPTYTRGAHASPGFLLAARPTEGGGKSPRRHFERVRPFLSVLLVIGATRPLCQVVLAEGEPEPDHIVVTGKAPAATEIRAPTSFVDTIDATDRPGELQTTADLLAEAPGVQVRRFGGLGAFSTISIRGSSANQVQIYLDGIPLSRARSNVVDLSGLPLDGLQRIDVYRGTAPLGFSGGIGGVVNLVTRPATETPQTEVSASYGSFETRKAVASHSQRLKGTDFLGYVTYLGSEGDFPFKGSPEDEGEDADVAVTKTRINNQFNAVDALVKATRDLGPDLTADAMTELFFRDGGVPGDENDQAQHASLRQWRSFNYLRLRSEGLLEDNLDASAALFGIYERDELNDESSPPELGFSQQDRRDQNTLVGGNLDGTYWLLAKHPIGWFAELSYEWFSGFNAKESGALRNEPDQTRLTASLATQPQIQLFDERVLIVPTSRFDHLRDSTSELPRTSAVPAGSRETTHTNLWNSSVGAQVRLLPELRLRGNIGRFQRAPTFVELFGNSGVVRGNPDLDPEKAINGDVGLVAEVDELGWLSDLYAEYVYFNNDIDDVIVLVQVSQDAFRPRNVGKSRIRGHEITFRTVGLDHLAVSLNYTKQDPEIRSGAQKGNKLPGRPGDEFYLRTELFNQFGRLFYEFNLVGGNYVGEANLERVPTRRVHTIGFTTSIPSWLTVGFEARNITNNQISDVLDFPLPGLSFFGTVGAKF
jgi:iron complex outermembrane receptor protein